MSSSNSQSISNWEVWYSKESQALFEVGNDTMRRYCLTDKMKHIFTIFNCSYESARDVYQAWQKSVLV